MADKHRGTENPQYARDMVELRRSNAAGTHADKRTRRARTRSDAKRAAIRDGRAA
jgi:hypothetical protein